MSNIKQALETSDTPTITLASLTNGSGRGSTAIDNSSNLDVQASVFVKIKTGGSSTSATGHIDLYVIKAIDGTNYDDAFGGTDGAFTASAATYIGSIPAVANSTSYQGSIDLGRILDVLPKSFSIGIVNNSGGTLDATGGNFSLIVVRRYFTVV